VAKSRMADKAVKLVGKARLQSLATEKEDPRLFVTVAGETGYNEVKDATYHQKMLPIIKRCYLSSRCLPLPLICEAKKKTCLSLCRAEFFLLRVSPNVIPPPLRTHTHTHARISQMNQRPIFEFRFVFDSLGLLCSRTILEAARIV